MMLKSRFSVYQLNYPSNGNDTPSKGYHDDDTISVRSLRHYRGNPYSNSLWNTSADNREALNRIREKSANKRLREEPSTSVAGLQEQSIEWGTEKEPQQKKTYSPLDVETFNQRMSISPQRPDPKLLSYVQSLQRLIDSEGQYHNSMVLCLTTYKEEACHNKKFKNKLLNKSLNEELLLFGSLDTISELSKLFYKQLRTTITESLNLRWEDNLWTKVKSDEVLCKRLLEIDLAEIFISYFHRMKTTYQSYCSSRKQQKILLETIKLQRTEIFYKWYELCLKRAHFEKLEDMLELPLNRLGHFASLLEDLILFGDSLLSTDMYSKLNTLFGEFVIYLQGLNEQLSPNSNTEVKTPEDIATFYGVVNGNLSKENKSKISPIKMLLDPGSAGLKNSHLSDSSSFYSEIPTSENTRPSSTQPLNFCSQEESQLLKDSTKVFASLYSNLQKLETALGRLDLAKILDRNLSHAITWKNLIEFEAPSGIFNPGDDTRTIYGAYVEKIDKQRQQVMLLQLQDLRRKVIKPLQALLQKCATVKQKLADRSSLKKEYLDYLRQKDIHNAKKEILANSFQELQTKLADSLPVFNNHLKEIVALLLHQYIELMMEYMKILAGGEQFLKKELEIVDSGQREIGDNFDILELFCSSRYYTRQAVRDNWNYGGDPRASRVVRKLFEI